MGLRHVAVATTLALAGTTLVAGPAQARPDDSQVTRDGLHFPSSVSTTVPPGGYSMITSPTIPKDFRTLTVVVKPKNPDATENDVYDKFVNTIGSLTKGQRLLVCAMMYQSLVTPQDTYTGEFELDALNATVAGVVLLACLQLAGLLTADSRMSAKAAASKCGQVRPSLPATVKKVNGGYSLKASGKSRKAKKPKLKIGCKVQGNKVTYTLRARKKGVPLRKVVGKRLMVGIQSPADAATSVPVKVTFKRP